MSNIFDLGWDEVDSAAAGTGVLLANSDVTVRRPDPENSFRLNKLVESSRSLKVKVHEDLN